jgi:hypothetical protein
MRGNTSAIYEKPEDCSPYAEGKNAEPYKDNAPTISLEFKPNTSYLYEYYWDGEVWWVRDIQKPLQKISEYKEEE